MTRPPFDPKRARGDAFAGGLFDPTPVARPVTPRDAEPGDGAGADSAAPVARESKELTVTQFSDLISRTLEDGMRGAFRVQGEIANLSKRGHWYFSVKDAGAVLSCVMWQSDAARASYDAREGDAVVVTGRIKHYAPQGRTQLYVTKVEKQGLGTLEQQFQALVAELRGLGYFDESRKKPLPEFPRRVAVITSRSGAALQDVLKTAADRCPAVEFIVVDVRVQGEGAAGEVARALRAVDRMHGTLAIDAVIVTRGGGSREDLWAFNERVVADAAHAMSIPLVAAIGHEVDTSVIELVADRRASTPTQAVMLLLPDLEALADRRASAARDLRSAMRWKVSTLREALSELAASPALQSPALRIATARGRLLEAGSRARAAALAVLSRERRVIDALGARLVSHSPAARAAAERARLASLGPRLARSIAQSLAHTRRDLQNTERRLRSAGPEETLGRGYAIVTASDGALVRSVSAAPAGTPLQVQLSDGTLPVRVEPNR